MYGNKKRTHLHRWLLALIFLDLFCVHLLQRKNVFVERNLSKHFAHFVTLVLFDYAEKRHECLKTPQEQSIHETPRYYLTFLWLLHVEQICRNQKYKINGKKSWLSHSNIHAISCTRQGMHNRCNKGRMRGGCQSYIYEHCVGMMFT